MSSFSSHHTFLMLSGPQNRGEKCTITLQLCDGFQKEGHFYDCDTLQKVMDSLRQSGEVFCIDSVLHKGRALSSYKGWKEWTLEECGIRNGDRLYLSTTFPREVDIAILSMERVFTVTVERGENCWERIREQLPIPADRKFNVFNQRRLFYRRHHVWHSAVSDRSHKNFVYYDEEDGKLVPAQEGTFYVDDFLAPDQGLRAAPHGRPYLWVFDDVLGSNERRITVLSQQSLFDPQFIACVYGMRCYLENDEQKMFLRCENAIFETKSGVGYETVNDVFKSLEDRNVRVRYFYLLLREYDLIPLWNIPYEDTVSVLTRNGIELKVRRNRILSVLPRLFDSRSSSWLVPFKGNQFQEDFSNSVRGDPGGAMKKANDDKQR